ncbi:unnamed protein product, partial [Brenthis ino]
MAEVLQIDGSVLEGGGQILRMSISLSAILGIPVRVQNIRAGRSKPGLAAQHLKGIQLLAEMCQAQLKGASIGSTEIEFIPGEIKGGHYVADTKTAGSISLLLQVALPCALFADSPVILDLKGGTNADMAPQIDYMERIFKNVLREFGAVFRMNILRRGYYPKGGGHVWVEITPIHSLKSVRLTERGQVKDITGMSFVSGVLPVKLAHTVAEGVRQELGEYKVKIHSYKEDQNIAPDSCSGIVLSCNTTTGCVLGNDALGSRRAGPREVARKVSSELKNILDSGACVDPHSQDQVIIYMALASGESAVRAGDITLHTRTAIYISEMIAKVKFNIRHEGDQNLIECSGLGFVNKHISDK